VNGVRFQPASRSVMGCACGRRDVSLSLSLSLSLSFCLPSFIPPLPTLPAPAAATQPPSSVRLGGPPLNTATCLCRPRSHSKHELSHFFSLFLSFLFPFSLRSLSPHSLPPHQSQFVVRECVCKPSGPQLARLDLLRATALSYRVATTLVTGWGPS
jgi:hypothetical protein